MMSLVSKLWCAGVLLGAAAMPSLAFTAPLHINNGARCCSRTQTGATGISRSPREAYGWVHPARRPSSTLTCTDATTADTPVIESSVASVEEMDVENEGGNIFTACRPITEGQLYLAIEVVFVVALAGLVDAGFSGDWQARGVLSDAVAGTARTACCVTAAAHVILTGVSLFIAKAKGIGMGSAATTLLTGPLGFLKVAAAYDEEELETQAAAKAAPLSMVINSLEMSNRQTPAAVLLTTSVRARRGREASMRKLLEELVEETSRNEREIVLTCTVNQDPGDRSSFIMLQRFPSAEAMAVFQNSETFQAFTDGAEDCIDGPMGLYLVNERSGKLSEPVHPFGPGGEGGRDDAIYSSPANVQGALRTNF